MSTQLVCNVWISYISDIEAFFECNYSCIPYKFLHEDTKNEMIAFQYFSREIYLECKVRAAAVYVEFANKLLKLIQYSLCQIKLKTEQNISHFWKIQNVLFPAFDQSVPHVLK